MIGQSVSWSDLNVEMGNAANSEISLNAVSVRWLGGVSSGQISATDLQYTYRTPQTQVNVNNYPYITNVLSDIAVGAGKTVFISQDDAFSTSTPAVKTSWQRITTNSINGAIIYANGKFVIGAIQKTLISTDGINFSVHANSFAIAGLAANSSLYVGVSQGNIITSSDGITWTLRFNVPNFFFQKICYSGTQFVAVGGGLNIYTSPDGITWTARSTGSNLIYSGVVWAGALFILVSTVGSIKTSPDGITWTNRTSGTSLAMSSVAYNSALAIIVGENGKILSSPDGITWTNRTSNTTSFLRDVIWSGSDWLVCGSGGTLITSVNGINWTYLSTEDKPDISNDKIASNNNVNPIFVLVNQQSGIFNALRSTDGITYTNKTSFANIQIYSIENVNNVFFLLGESFSGDSIMYTSFDGTTWTQRMIGQSGSVNSVAYDGSIYVAISTNGNVWTSTDLNTWIYRTTLASTLTGVAYGNGFFLITSGDGYANMAFKSTNGTTWTQVLTNINDPMNGVVFLKGVFTSWTTEKTDYEFPDCIFTSTNGITWTYKNIPAFEYSGCPFIYSSGWDLWTVDIGTNTFYWSYDNFDSYVSSSITAYGKLARNPKTIANRAPYFVWRNAPITPSL